MISFGENLKRLRLKNSLTQEQVGDFCGVSAKAISRYENDLAEPDLQLLKRFSKLFHVDYNKLLGFSGKPSDEEELILKKGESIFIEHYRKCDKVHQTIVRKIVKDFAEINYLVRFDNDEALSYLHEEDQSDD